MEVNSTLLIQLFLFLGLLGFLSQFLFKPIFKLFEERERRIEGARKEAALLNQQAGAKLEEIENRIHLAQREAKQALFNLQAEGARFHREMLDKAHEESQRRLREAQEDLNRQINQLRLELLPTEPILSQQIIRRFLGETSMSRQQESSHA